MIPADGVEEDSSRDLPSGSCKFKVHVKVSTMAGGIAGRDSSLLSAGVTHPHPGHRLLTSSSATSTAEHGTGFDRGQAAGGGRASVRSLGSRRLHVFPPVLVHVCHRHKRSVS